VSAGGSRDLRGLRGQEQADVEPDPGSVLRTFALGREVVSMEPVPGAWSNRVYRLTTDTGQFAVKQLLNPWRDPRWAEWLDEAWRFERAAFLAGVAMPEPVPNPATRHWLGQVEASTARRRGSEPDASALVRVHRWVDGVPMGSGPAEPAVARWAGQVLAMLHGLEMVPADRSLFPQPDTVTADRWPELVELARRHQAPWADRLEAASGTVEGMARLARSARQRPELEVMSHGDIDQKNVVLTTRGPVLCDWDVAAPQLPAREVADLALSMADWVRFDIARTVVRAYFDAGGLDTDIEPADLGPQLMTGLDWIAFNVERAVGTRGARPQDVALGNRLVPELVARLPEQLNVSLRVTELLGVP
jgi:Ser/Thr protein kinase RdoA (MazF antagonist)